MCDFVSRRCQQDVIEQIRRRQPGVDGDTEEVPPLYDKNASTRRSVTLEPPYAPAYTLLLPNQVADHDITTAAATTAAAAAAASDLEESEIGGLDKPPTFACVLAETHRGRPSIELAGAPPTMTSSSSGERSHADAAAADRSAAVAVGTVEQPSARGVVTARHRSPSETL